VSAILSSLAWVSEVEFSWLEVAECGVQADVVVLVDKLLHFALGGEVVVSVVVLVTCPPRSTPVKKRVLPNSKGARRTTCGKVCLPRLRSLGF